MKEKQPVAMMHIGLPLPGVNQWSSDEEIRKVMAARVREISLPEDAYSHVWFSFLPEPEGGLTFRVQDGFHQDLSGNPHISEIE